MLVLMMVMTGPVLMTGRVLMGVHMVMGGLVWCLQHSGNPNR